MTHEVERRFPRGVLDRPAQLALRGVHHVQLELARKARVELHVYDVLYSAERRRQQLADHRLQHRLLPEVGLELARATAGAAAKDELAKADDPSRAAATEDVDRFALQAFLAAADVVHYAEAPARETQGDRPALLAVSGVARGECAYLDRQALCEVNSEINEVADVAKKYSAALDLVLE